MKGRHRPGLALRLLLALVLLWAPLAAPRPLAAAPGIPICAADGGVRQLPDPSAPVLPAGHGHCDACLIAPPALPAASPGMRLPVVAAFTWLPPPEAMLAPPDAPAARARSPPRARAA